MSMYRVCVMPTVSKPKLVFIYPASYLSEAEIASEAISLFHIFLDDNGLTKIDANMVTIEVSDDEGETWTDIENV